MIQDTGSLPIEKTKLHFIMMSVHLLSLNCNGLNSSMNDVLDILGDKTNAIFFLCEHWLRMEELNGISALCENEGLWSHLKTSVDPEEDLTGRPYGGVGFICKWADTKAYSFRIINVDNDRISALQVIKNGTILLNVIGVYLPYYNGRAEQSTLYAETLDAVQSVIENCSNAPTVIMGDMNAALPQSKDLHHLWYRNHPFNSNSMQLYDFLCNNEMVVANFSFQQEINYTYRKGQHRTYIDHMLMTNQAMRNVTQCKIIYSDECWTSDHFPLETVYSLHVPSDETEAPYCDQHTEYPKINWSNSTTRSDYNKRLAQAFQSSANFDYSAVNSIHKAQQIADEYCEKITSAIHKVCADINLHETKRRGPRKNPWWSADCTSARDRTRFWHRIWIQGGRDNLLPLPVINMLRNCTGRLDKSPSVILPTIT